MDCIDFKEEYKKEISVVFSDLVQTLCTERSFYNCNFKDINTETIAGNIIPIHNLKIGSFNSQMGHFYENRLEIINDIIHSEKFKSFFNPYGYFIKESKNQTISGRLSKTTLKLINDISEEIYNTKNITLEEFNKYLTNIINSMSKSKYDEESTKFIFHKIDGLIDTKDNLTYLLESKTKAQEQNDIAKGCIKRVLRSWALLILEKYKETGMFLRDSIRIVVLMNNLSDTTLFNAFYWPRFDINVKGSNGVLSNEGFYKYFYNLDYSDIINVEKEYGKKANQLMIESDIYEFVNAIGKYQGIDDDFIVLQIKKYILPLLREYKI